MPAKLDPVAEVILELLNDRPGSSIGPVDAARAFAERQWEPAEPPPDEWRTYLNTARQQALHLAREGRIEILRKGKPADPEGPIKGVIRLALPAARKVD